MNCSVDLCMHATCVYMQADDVEDNLSAHSSALNVAVTSRPVSQLSVPSPFLMCMLLT